MRRDRVYIAGPMSGYPDHNFPARSTFYDRGRWTFGFQHTLTGFVCELDIHGLTAEQERAFLFPPRIYWRGCSSSIPELTDWLTDGFEIAIVPIGGPDREAV